MSDITCPECGSRKIALNGEWEIDGNQIDKWWVCGRCYHNWRWEGESKPTYDELEQQLAAAEARAERLEALYREARRAHCYSLTIDHNVREKWESEFNVATDAAIRAAKEETK